MKLWRSDNPKTKTTQNVEYVLGLAAILLVIASRFMSCRAGYTDADSEITSWMSRAIDSITAAAKVSPTPAAQTEGLVTVTVRGEDILINGESATQEELAALLQEEGKTFALLEENAAAETLETVTKLFESSGVEISAGK